MRDEKCERCRFWERIEFDNLYEREQALVCDGETVQVGECHRRAPQFDGVENARVNEQRMKVTKICNADTITYAAKCASRWPITWDVDWCGEFEPCRQQGNVVE